MSGWVMSEEMSEMDMMRQVATDRLVYMRVMEKCVNDMDMALSSLKRDITEISRQVAARNEELSLASSEEESEEKADD